MMPLLTAALFVLLEGVAVVGRVTVDARQGASPANILVYVRSGLPARSKYQAPSAPVPLALRECAFAPSVVVVQVGQPLDITNRDPVPRRVSAFGTRGRAFTVTVPSGGRVRRYLATPEVPIRLQCETSPAQAMVAVLVHPFHAVTGSDGRYALRNLPPGDYVIEAWHERLGARTASVSVRAGGGALVAQDFRFAAP